MNTLSSNCEARLVDSAEKMVDLTNSGVHPNDALFKIASEEQLTPHFIRRLGEVFNASRVLAHFKSASIETRADEFPLADPQNVIDKIYGEKKEAVYVDDAGFAPPPDFNVFNDSVKVAADEDITVRNSYDNVDIFSTKRAILQRDGVKRCLDVARDDVAFYNEKLTETICKIASHFRAMYHTPFKDYERNVVGVYGDVGKSLADTVYEISCGATFGEKRATDFSDVGDFDESAELYVLTKQAVDLATKCSEAHATVAKFTNELKKCDESLKKSAVGITSTLANSMFLKNQLNQMIHGGQRSSDVASVLDPAHETELASIEMRAALNDMLANDPIISQHDPASVRNAYNEIVKTTPRIGQQPGILRGVLARRLELGRLDPFESKNLIDTESAIKKLTTPTNVTVDNEQSNSF